MRVVCQKSLRFLNLAPVCITKKLGGIRFCCFLSVRVLRMSIVSDAGLRRAMAWRMLTAFSRGLMWQVMDGGKAAR